MVTYCILVQSTLFCLQLIWNLVIVVVIWSIAVYFQDKILLKFKISYMLNDAMRTDIGEVQFPDAV